MAALGALLGPVGAPVGSLLDVSCWHQDSVENLRDARESRGVSSSGV